MATLRKENEELRKENEELRKENEEKLKDVLLSVQTNMEACPYNYTYHSFSIDTTVSGLKRI